MGAQICVKRGVGGIVAITLVTVEVWMSPWWNDRGHVGSGRGSRAPVHYAGHVHPIGRNGCRGWGPPWLPVLPEGSTCLSGEAEVR
jgi:hypothetical protein